VDKLIVYWGGKGLVFPRKVGITEEGMYYSNSKSGSFRVTFEGEGFGIISSLPEEEPLNSVCMGSLVPPSKINQYD
jgi:hypothetical protein